MPTTCESVVHYSMNTCNRWEHASVYIIQTHRQLYFRLEIRACRLSFASGSTSETPNPIEANNGPPRTRKAAASKSCVFREFLQGFVKSDGFVEAKWRFPQRSHDSSEWSSSEKATLTRFFVIFGSERVKAELWAVLEMRLGRRALNVTSLECMRVDVHFRQPLRTFCAFFWIIRHWSHGGVRNVITQIDKKSVV